MPTGPGSARPGGPSRPPARPAPPWPSRRGPFPASGRSDAILAECRRALADLTGAEPDGVILGPNMTTLTYRLAETLSRQWGPGGEGGGSRLDHGAKVRPGVQAGAGR